MYDVCVGMMSVYDVCAHLCVCVYVCVCMMCMYVCMYDVCVCVYV